VGYCSGIGEFDETKSRFISYTAMRRPQKTPLCLCATQPIRNAMTRPNTGVLFAARISVQPFLDKAGDGRADPQHGVNPARDKSPHQE